MTHKEKPAVNAGFLTARSQGPGFLEAILQVLSNHGEAYKPELIELGRADNHVVVRFERNEVKRLSQKWDQIPPPEVWDLRRHQPAGLLVTLMKSSLDFVPFLLQANKDFLDSQEKTQEFLEIAKQFYDVLHPAHGDISLHEMVKRYDNRFGGAKMNLGVNLKRALPDLYWANFLGPEYVSMFGSSRLLTAPCHSAEQLRDGGVLLVLTPSLFDYTKNPAGFEHLRQKAKEHLGIEAFDTGDPNYKGRTPEFRFVDNGKKMVTSLTRPRPGSDKFLRLTHQEWNEWIENNQDLALAFIRDMNSRSIELDLSPRSLSTLDEYVRKLRVADAKPADDFLKKMAAYVSQVVIRETGASWSFKSDDVPGLSVGEIYLSPVARVEKVIAEGETFEHWYRFLTEELIPKSN